MFSLTQPLALPSFLSSRRSLSFFLCFYSSFSPLTHNSFLPFFSALISCLYPLLLLNPSLLSLVALAPPSTSILAASHSFPFLSVHPSPSSSLLQLRMPHPCMSCLRLSPTSLFLIFSLLVAPLSCNPCSPSSLLSTPLPTYLYHLFTST